MLKVKRLKIKGFRGFNEEQELIFSNPAVLLFGENHLGKSSTLNAIEWCLFGNQCAKKETGISERAGWIIKNLYYKDKGLAFVEMDLEDKDKEVFTIKRGFVNNRKTRLIIRKPDGTQLEDEEAERFLYSLIKLSFKDFLTTIYQHQEVIRYIIAKEAKERNDAIDRLLGLSEYAEILEAIETIKVEELMKSLSGALNEMEKKLEYKIEARFEEMRRIKKEAEEEKVEEKDLNEKEPINLCREIKEKIKKIIIKTDSGIKELPPDIREWRDFLNFKEEVEGLLNRIMGGGLHGKELSDLLYKKTTLDSIKRNYTNLLKELKEIKKNLDTLTKEGGERELEQRLKELEEKKKKKEEDMESLSREATLIDKSLSILKKRDKDRDICPVCGQETPQLIEHLQNRWNRIYTENLGMIKKEIEELEREIKSLNEKRERIVNITRLEQNKRSMLGEERKKTESLLNREIKEEDDVISIIDKEIKKIDMEIEKIKENIESKQREINALLKTLKRGEYIFKTLKLKEDIDRINRFKESPEYKSLMELRERVAQFVEDVKAIQEAIMADSKDYAEERIEKVNHSINRYFNMITEHPVINNIRIHTGRGRTGRNSYEFRGSNGEDLIPIMSQGDLNALALSIFLSMAMESSSHKLGFIMLDDPSQSLGTHYKKNLVEIINEILEKGKMVMVSTMDREFQEFIEEGITKLKDKFIFKGWSPSRGPDIIKGESDL